jgi:flagellar hook-basal body complex protein FliE
MSPLASVGGVVSPLLGRVGQAAPVDAPAGPGALTLGTPPPAGAGFGSMLGDLVAAVDAKQDHAQQVTRSVLLGQGAQLHESVIAMQEAGVSFQLMVEVRNKLVESYQELMRMPV